jgi:hypothetical protein
MVWTGIVLRPAHGVERALHFSKAEAYVHQAARGEGAALRCVSALARIPTFADLARDVLLAECLLRMERVVAAAAHAQVPELVRAAACSWDDVIELEPGRRRAAMPFGIGERAALAVPPEDRAARRPRDARGIALLSRWSRARGLPEPLRLERSRKQPVLAVLG